MKNKTKQDSCFQGTILRSISWGLGKSYIYFFMMTSDNKNQKGSITYFRKEHLEMVLSNWQKEYKEALNEEADYELRC